MAPIPIRSISNYDYADWLHVIHPDTEGTSHAPAEHREQPRSIGVTPTNACRDKLLQDRATICVHNSGSGTGTFGKRNVTQAGGLGKRLTFTRTWKEWWAHHWHQSKEFFHHSGSKGEINSKRGAGNLVNGNGTAPAVEGEKHSNERHFGEWIKNTYHKMVEWIQSSKPEPGTVAVNWKRRIRDLKNGSTTTPIVKADKKTKHYGFRWIEKDWHKINDWVQSWKPEYEPGDVAVNWKREKGVEVTQNFDAPQSITSDPSNITEFAHFALHDISSKNTNLTYPVNLLNGTNMTSGNATHHSAFSGFHFVEAQSVDGIIPLGIPNYAFAFRDSELDKIVGCFFAGVFVFFGIKWGLDVLKARRRC